MSQTMYTPPVNPPTDPPAVEPRRRTRWPWFLGSGALVAGIVIGVAVGPGAPAAPVAQPTPTILAVPHTPTQAAPPPSKPAPNPHFGESYTYADGLAVMVTAPRPYTPSGGAAGAVPGSQAIAVDISIINNTGSNFAPGLFIVQAQSGTADSPQIFDSANNLLGVPSTTLLSGRSVTYTAAFSVADPADVIVQVTPGVTYKPAIFVP